MVLSDFAAGCSWRRRTALWSGVVARLAAYGYAAAAASLDASAFG